MLDLVITQRRRSLGGFDVGRVLPFAKRRMVGPFVFFDHMGPIDLAAGIPDEVDVLPHPHIGLSTVTYLFDGEIMHRDSIGSEQAIRPGEVNWMTAGRGITHSERFERARREGGRVHGIQAWVALPEADEETDPAFAHHGAEDLPTFEENGVWGRLVAGTALGLHADVQTHSPLFYLHWALAPGARAELPADYPERAIYVAEGTVTVAGQRFDTGQMLVLTPGALVTIKAETPAIVMALGGEPLGPRFIDWNFVSSSKERIEQAKADWRAGRMKLPDLDHDSFTPLPPEPGAPAEQLGIPRRTFYRWYDRYLEGGPEALEDRPSAPRRVWNRIGDDIQQQIIDMALDTTDLSPRELAVRFTDEKRYFVSEATVYRLLKAHDLITSPAFVVIRAADAFHTKTTRPNEMWQTDFTYFKIIGWGWVYLSTVLDDFSRYIIAWKLCTNMRAEDVTDTLDLALEASGCDSATVLHKPRLLSDNGPSYIAGELAEYIEARKMSHVRGAPMHPQTQGKIERWHQTLKNRILLENYFLPGDLEAQIEAFVEHYNHRRYHESLNNVTPADAYFGRADAIIKQRERIKRKTIEHRRLLHRKIAA